MPMRFGASWMPLLWADGECKPEALNEDFWQATKPHRADFEKLGFTECRLGKARKSLNPIIRESGAIFYLDPTRRYLGRLIFMQIYNPLLKKPINSISVAFTAVFERGTLSCTSRSLSLDSAGLDKVVRLNSNDVPEIYKRFQDELQRNAETPQSFSDPESLRQWYDARATGNFEERVQRRLFIRMTEPEIAAALADLDRKPPRPVRPGFFWIYWSLVCLMILCVALALILKVVVNVHQHRLLQIPDTTGENTVAMSTVDYQGQRFKLSRSYTDFDVYKNDPNNLDTNELPRIERTMESVKIPATFKDYKEFIYVTVNLTFPGYGESAGFGRADDGSKLLFDLTEIPRADKERVVVARSESDGSWKLVDDFIYEGSDTNDINCVRLEHRQLEYFDQRGRLVRKKAL